MPRPSPKSLSELEHLLMQVVWSQGPCSADTIRQALARKRPLKDSTIRTVLCRLEEKGFLKHKVEGRTYIYEHIAPPEQVATKALRHIIDRFCGGSVEGLLVGMVNDRMISTQQLQELARKIAQTKGDDK